MALSVSHPDYYTQALQFTPTIHRAVPPSLQPITPLLTSAASGRRVLITGAGSGFGRAAALQWARAGPAVIMLCGRRREALERVKCEVEATAKDNATVISAAEGDASVEGDVLRHFEHATRDLGAEINVVVHAAGVLGPMERIGDVDVNAWWAGVVSSCPFPNSRVAPLMIRSVFPVIFIAKV